MTVRVQNADAKAIEIFVEQMRTIYAAERFKSSIDNTYDPERTHAAADELMCKTLRALGYRDGVKLFEDAERWYA